MNQTINILHITDFHLDKDIIEDFEKLIREPLKEDVLKRSNNDVDLLFITGDIVDKGGQSLGGLYEGLKMSQERVINKIASDLKLDEESIFIIPGNHDINRNAERDFIESGLKNDLIDSKKANKLIQEIKDGDLTGVKRLEEYRRFEKEFYKDYQCVNEDTFFSSTFTKEIKGHKIGISCFNSAWRCYSDDDFGHLFVGDKEVMGSKQLIQDCDIKIALIHHHIEYLHKEEKTVVENMLLKHYDLVFFGHSHNHNNYTKEKGENKCIWIGSPSTFLNARTGSLEFSSGYSLCGIKPDKTEIQYSYYSHSNTDFRTNSEIGKDGVDVFDSLLKTKQKNETLKEKTNVEFNTIPKTEIDNKLNVISKPSKLFTGREDKLKELKTALVDNEIISLTGIGGIGKTQLVLKLLESYDKEKITWSELDEGARFDTFIVASGFGVIIQSNKTEREKFSALVDKLNEHQRVVIWENFHDNKDDAFLRFIEFADGKLTESKIIIVSRTVTGKIKKFKNIELINFKESEVYTKVLIKQRHQGLALRDEDIKNICQYVNGHPLAIELTLNLCESLPLEKVIGRLAKHDVDVDSLSQRLFEDILELNSTKLEKDFLYQFSVFKGKVSLMEIEEIFEENSFHNILPRLKEKFLIDFDSEFYDTHPLIREFCYEKLENKKELHLKVAKWLISKRGASLNIILEERIYHHLKGANEYGLIVESIKKYGMVYLKQALYIQLQMMIDFLKSQNVSLPLLDSLEGEILELKGDLNGALICFKKVRDNKSDKRLALKGLLKTGYVFWDIGDYDKSLSVFNKSKRISEKENFQASIAMSYNGIAKVQKIYGNYDKSFTLFKKALNIAEGLNDRENLSTYYNNLGFLYTLKEFKRYNQDKAFFYFKKSLNLDLEFNNKHGLSRDYNNIGMIFQDKNYKNYNLDVSLNYYKKSLGISLEIGSKYGVSTNYNNIAMIYSDEEYEYKNLNKSLEFYEKSLSIAIDIGIREGEATTYWNMALVNLKKKNYEEAFVLIFKSYILSRDLKLKKELESIKEYIYILRNEFGLSLFRGYLNRALEKLQLKEVDRIHILSFMNLPKVNTKKYGRNNTIKVKYRDGTIISKKHKYLKEDLDNGKCEIIED